MFVRPVSGERSGMGFPYHGQEPEPGQAGYEPEIGELVVAGAEPFEVRAAGERGHW